MTWKRRESETSEAEKGKPIVFAQHPFALSPPPQVFCKEGTAEQQQRPRSKQGGPEEKGA